MHFSYKQLLDEVSVISRIIKVKVGVTITKSLIILDITKTESNNCFIIHWTKQKKRFLLLHLLCFAYSTVCSDVIVLYQARGLLPILDLNCTFSRLEVLGTFSNSYSRRRRRLRPIKTGVESEFSHQNRTTFSFHDGNVVTCHLPFAKQNSKCVKMNSFKNVQELLLLSYVNNVISDREQICIQLFHNKHWMLSFSSILE